jgi:hypothetical protein
MTFTQLSLATVLGAAMLVAPAFAQTPPDAIMLTPGVYTTPEISKKCQAFAAKRVGMSGYTDSSRQAVALQCAKKLWDQKLAKEKRARAS